MTSSKKGILRIIGVVLLFFGLLKIISRADDIFFSINIFFVPNTHNTLAEILYISGSILFFGLCLPILAIVSGWGLIKIKKWGRTWALIVLLSVFATNFLGAINFAIVSYQSRNIPMPKIPEGYHVESVSMWPTYIYALISALLILILKRKSLRQEFNN